jgi:hypothetical protein
LRVVERFTRVDNTTVLYEFTVDDPRTFTKPWSAEFPMMEAKGPVLEYACHEGNYGPANILSAGGLRRQQQPWQEAAPGRTRSRMAGPEGLRVRLGQAQGLGPKSTALGALALGPSAFSGP